MQLSIFESVLLYIIIVVLSTFFMHLADKGGKSQKFFLLMAFLVITLPSALRYYVGIDYAGYTDAYNIIINSGSILNSGWDIEYSFKLLSFISYNLVGSPQSLFATYAILTNLFMVLGIYSYRKETNMSTMMFMYTLLYYLMTMNIARQMLAVSIIFFASKFILKRSFLRYTLFVLLAVFFHKSAIIALPFYLLAIENEIIKQILLIVKFVAPIIIIFFLQKFINLFITLGFFKEYGASYIVVSKMTIGFGFVAMLIICILFYIVYKKNLLSCSKDIQYFIVQVMIFATILFLTEYSFANFGGRISFYFRIFEIVALSMLTTSANRREEGLRFDYQLVPYIYAILLFAVDLIRDGQGCLPYSLWIGHLM